MKALKVIVEKYRKSLDGINSF